MERYYLDWSELTRRVYITNGKKKKDVTEWFEKIVSERNGVKNISPNLPVCQQSEQFVCHWCKKQKIEFMNGLCESCHLNQFH